MSFDFVPTLLFTQVHFFTLETDYLEKPWVWLCTRGAVMVH